MTNYELLRKQFNKLKYGGTPPLEKNCEIVADMFGVKEIYTMIDSYYMVEDGKKGLYMYERFLQDGVPMKILGKHLTLQDILWMLNKKNKHYAVSTTGEIIIGKDHDYDEILYGFNSGYIYLDLTKDPQDWSEEVLGEIYQLIK